MKKKLLAVLLAAIMLIPMSFLASCHNDPETSETSTTESSQPSIVLTPKETFIKAVRSSGKSFKELDSALGFVMPETKITEKKNMTGSFEIELKELTISDVPFIENPIKIGFDYKSDVAKKLSQLNGNVSIGNSKLPINFIMSETAMYLGIDKVTEKILKMPIDTSNVDISVLYIDYANKFDVYFDAFCDTLSDDMFTQKSGDVTIDGVSISGANTIEVKITEKQFFTSIKVLLEKAKTDAEFSKIYGMFTSQDPTADKYEDAVAKAIQEIAKKIDESKEGNYTTFTVVTENDVFRSINADAYEDNKIEGSLAFSDVKKDGENVIKVRMYKDSTDFIVLSFNQKPNANGSADGKISLVMNIKEMNKLSDESSQTTSEVPIIGSNPDKVEISATYKGSKTGNKLSLDIDLELALYMDGAKVSFIPKITLVQEKVSDNEFKYSGDLSFATQGIKLALAFSSTDKISDDVSITVPADSECQLVDETFDPTTLFGKLGEQYPEIIEYFSGLFQSPDVEF